MKSEPGIREVIETALNKAIANGWDFRKYLKEHPTDIFPSPLYYFEPEQHLYLDVWHENTSKCIEYVYGIIYDPEFNKAYARS